MKKASKVLLVVLVVILAAGFIALDLLIFAGEKVTAVDGVTLSVQGDTVTPTGMTCVITNETDGEITFGKQFTLEKRCLFGWSKIYNLANIITGWPAVLLVVFPGGDRDLTFNWSYLYGHLSPGTYRLVKEATVNSQEHHIAWEFTIP